MTVRDLDFKISTGLKDVIGKELITEAHTAVFELVKNAYDANATHVDIVFRNIKPSSGSEGGKIFIVDDGDGMSYEDIRNRWLFVGYSKKGQDSDSDNFRDRVANTNRMMAGAKGIGRFSADRLGGNLILYTKTRFASTTHRLRMDWGKFEGNQDKEFHEVKVNYDTVGGFPREAERNLNHGTALEIFPLSDEWDVDMLLRLKRYLQRLVNPVQIPDGEKFKIRIVAEEFLGDDNMVGEEHDFKKINGDVTNIVLEKMGIKTTQITCNISESSVTTQLVDKGRLVFETAETNTYSKHLRDISINVFYLNRDAKNMFSRIMGIRPVRYGSVFLYKNGFRIHPYGEEKDDWLDLEKRKGQGYSRYLSTRELLGRIEINRHQSGFHEVSSRHGGVMETKEYLQLLHFMKTRVIKWLEKYVVEGLDWDRPEEESKKSSKGVTEEGIGVLAKFTNEIKDPDKRVTVNPDIASIVEEKRVRDLSEVMKNLRTLASYEEPDTQKAFKRELERVESIAKTHEARETTATRVLKIKEKEILFLKESQPADVKRAGDYAHWIGIVTEKIRNHLTDLIKAIHDGEDMESLMPIVESISWENQRIMMVSSYIDQANFDVRVVTKKADIVAHIVQYVDKVASVNLKRIKFTCRNKNIEFNVRFMPAAVFMMIDNFISNSEKAGARSVTFTFSIEGRTLRMLVSDDGDGIPDENKKLIFRRGFTTRKHGYGIGLSHVKTSVSVLGGNVRFLGNNLKGHGGGACFEVMIHAK